MIFLVSCKEKKLKKTTEEYETAFFSVNNRKIDEATFVSRVKHIMDSAQVAGLSMAVIKDAKISYTLQHGFENIAQAKPITENTIFEVASLSKPVFSYFVMQQKEKGFLDLNTPLYQYLPLKDLEHDARHKAITGRMILHHTSGLPNWRSETNDSLKLFFNPGEKFMYSGEGYQYLKNVLAHQRHVSDRGLDSIFKKEICVPMGITTMAFVWNQEMSKNKAYGHVDSIPTDNSYQRDPNLFGAAFSLHSTARDYAKFIIGVMHKTGLNTTSWEELMLVPNDTITKRIEGNRNLAFTAQNSKEGYQIFQHKGSNGDFKSLVRFYPHNNYGVVILSNSNNLYASGLLNYILSQIKS